MPAKLIDKFMHHPYEFSFTKALDVAFTFSQTVVIKSNINTSSKYSLISSIDTISREYMEIHMNIPTIWGIDGAMPDVYWEKYILYNKQFKEPIFDFFNIFSVRLILFLYNYHKLHNLECVSSTINSSFIYEILSNLSNLSVNFHGFFWPVSKSAYSLKCMLRAVFNVNVQIIEFQKKKIKIQNKDRTKIGKTTGRFNCLGRSAILGDYFYYPLGTMQILIGPLPFEKYITFLPKNSKRDDKYSLLYKLKSLIKMYVSSNIFVYLKIILDTSNVGWTILNGTKRLDYDAFIFGATKNISYNTVL